MNKFTRRIAWTGKIWIAMMCAFLVGSIASMVLAADPGSAKGSAEASPDSAGMTWEQFAGFFGWDPNDAAIALEDYDGDGLSNLSEWYQRTDPSRVDTDGNGSPDGISPVICRARLDFHPLFTAGNSFSYFWPSFMVSGFKISGAWAPELPAWYVPAGASGKLCLTVDRSILSGDVILELEFYDADAPEAGLFVDLVNEEGKVIISSESEGNLIAGSGMIVREALYLPLKDYWQANRVIIRGNGELFLFEGLLYPVVPDRAEANSQVGGRLGETPRPTSSDIPIRQDTAARPTRAGSKTSPRSFPATRLKSITIPQFIMAQQAGGQAWMSDGDFIISRDTLNGGGTRQTSPAFIMEDSFAQSSAIGFSFGSNITLHAGYQQAEVERLEIWNVSVTPPPYRAQLRHFNPTLGETATFSYVLSTPAKAITVKVYDDIGISVRTLLAQQPQSGGLQTVAWDGKNDAGSFVLPNRKYTNTLSATSYDGVATNYQPADINEVQMEVENIPVIQSVADQPDPFLPAIDTNSTISYVTAPASNNLDIAIQIYAGNLSGLPVRAWITNQSPGSYSVVWDGTDSNGTEMVDGLYAYSISDNTFPALQKNANKKTGAITLLRLNTQNVASADGQVKVHYSGPSVVSITSASPVEASDGLFAIKTAAPGQMLESMIYRIEATPPTNFVMAFKYDSAISGDIGEKLQLRRYNATNRVWDIVPIQFIDYANHQILAEITSLSLFALFLGEDTTPPVIQIISPEAREYYQNAVIDILYEVEDPVVGGISSGVTEVFVYLNGELYPYATIPPSALRLGENVLTIVAFDGAGNIGRATVSFTVILEARVTLKPEALNVNPGILTAFVSLPEDYDPVYITDATCDGAAYESMRLNEDGTEMIIKFRRQDIETALAQTGESIDIYFVVRGTWQDAAGNSYVFQGTDSITKIIGAR